MIDVIISGLIACIILVVILFLVENLIIAEISRENDLRLCGLDVVCLNRIHDRVYLMEVMFDVPQCFHNTDFT